MGSSPVFGAEFDSQGSTAVHVALPERLPYGPGHADRSGDDWAGPGKWMEV